MANLGDAEGATKRSPLRRLLAVDELGIFVALVVFFIIGASSSPYFVTVSNLTGILQNITFLGFLSIGVGLVLMAGEIDISVGSIFGLTGVATALVLRQGYPLAAAIASGLLVGAACGLINGLVAQVIKIPVVVMTLATLGIYRAIALALANGSPVAQVPHITILFLIVALIAEIVLRWTSSGFRLLAIGSNPQAARLVGFHVERTRVLLLAFSGFIAGLSGVCSVAYLDTASPTAGTGYELSVLAAVIIGGVKLTGGRGSILGVLLGLCVIGIFQNLIVLWGVSPNWTQGVSGLVLIAAMTLIWLTRGNERAAGG
jgi:ribose/xylose/arabinose/galactoside ABC-type transport system permease subunit